MGRARARLTRNGLASLAVVAVLAAVGFGLPALNARIPATHRLRPGQRYPVAARVSVVPPPGAQYDVTRTATSRDGSEGAVLFVLGSVRLTVVVLRFDGSLAQAARQLRTTITRYALDRYGRRAAREVRYLQEAQARLAVELSRGGVDAERFRDRARECRAHLRRLGHPEAYAPPGAVPPWWLVLGVLLAIGGLCVLFVAVVSGLTVA